MAIQLARMAIGVEDGPVLRVHDDDGVVGVLEERAVLALAPSQLVLGGLALEDVPELGADHPDDVEQVRAAGEATGDHVWAWPLHGSYRRYIDSTFADMKNSSDLREGAPALAAEFLREFAGQGPWAHLDIAGPAFLDRARGDYLWQPGGTGYGVRLIAELASRIA